MTRARLLIGAAAGALGLAGAAFAQTPPAQPKWPLPENPIPEKMRPQDPSSTGSTGPGASLSDKLEATDGVIKPPTGIDPEITTPAPVPDPGTTPVIRPPGTPGGDPTVQPK